MVRKSSGRMQETTPLIKQRRLIWHQAYGLTFTDNSCIESFHSLLKKEEVYCKIYKDSNDAYKSIFEYIESWYNHRRTHSSLGYKTPDAVHAEGAA